MNRLRNAIPDLRPEAVSYLTGLFTGILGTALIVVWLIAVTGYWGK
jgi:hypothetical protein